MHYVYSKSVFFAVVSRPKRQSVYRYSERLSVVRHFVLRVVRINEYVSSKYWWTRETKKRRTRCRCSYGFFVYVSSIYRKIIVLMNRNRTRARKKNAAALYKGIYFADVSGQHDFLPSGTTTLSAYIFPIVISRIDMKNKGFCILEIGSYQRIPPPKFEYVQRCYSERKKGVIVKG